MMYFQKTQEKNKQLEASKVPGPTKTNLLPSPKTPQTQKNIGRLTKPTKLCKNNKSFMLKVDQLY